MIKRIKKLFRHLHSNTQAKQRLKQVLASDRIAQAPGLWESLESELKKLITARLELPCEETDCTVSSRRDRESTQINICLAVHMPI